MPVPSTIADLSKVASENSPAGTESVKGTIDDYFRAHASFIRQLSDLVGGPTVTLTSAAVVNIGFAASTNILITGTNTIGNFDTIAEGTLRWVTFNGALTLVHGAALQLPGSANITTASGDAALFKSQGAGAWKCLAFMHNAVRYPASGLLLSDAAPVSIAQGGTASINAAGARANLGVPATADVILKNQTNSSVGTRLVSGAAPAISSMNGNNGNEDNVPLIIGNNSNDAASSVIQFLRSGRFAAFFGLDTDNKFKVGGYSMGANAYEIFHQGNFNPGNYAALSGAAFAGNISAPVVTETSDERKKKAWQRLPGDFIGKLASIRKAGLFTWKRGGARGLGVGAQSLEQILPDAVHTDERGAKTVQYGAAALVSAVELARAVVDLQTRLAKLEAR
jgi:hypothetical protein